MIRSVIMYNHIINFYAKTALYSSISPIKTTEEHISGMKQVGFIVKREIYCQNIVKYKTY